MASRAHGPSVLPVGVRFSVWAPERERIAVRTGGADHPLAPAGGGWFEGAVPDAADGTRYALVVDGGRVRPDPATARQRLAQITDEVSSTAKKVGQSIARGTQYTGWTLFVTILLGSGAGLFGGAWGARRNFRQPMTQRDYRLATESRPQWLARRPEPTNGKETRPVT